MPSRSSGWPWLRSLALVVGSVCALMNRADGATPDDGAGLAFFEAKIRPVLVERCYSCHSGEAKRPKGELRLDDRETLRRGGASGPAIVPGNADESLLIKAIAHADDVSPMPPKGKLPDPVVADFRRWINLGAPDPREKSAASTSPKPVADPAWWSLKPIVQASLPTDRTGWTRSPIDAFVLDRLTAKGLKPSPEADRRTLIRRLSFDLIGLPPTLEEIETFLKDAKADAYERLVDRLLNSPHYGERWGRHWMDVVHFAETHGHDQDRIRPNAWPYRDYLISAFNRDTPYPRFVREQLAVDVLYPAEPALTVALGMISAGPWDESSLRDIREDTIDRAFGRYLDRDDMLTTVMSTFVSLTVGCARCHDHKFDPIPQADYYSLQAVFAGTDRADRPYDPDSSLARKRRELTSRRDALRRRDPTALASLLNPESQAEVKSWEARLGAKPPVWGVLDLSVKLKQIFPTDHPAGKFRLFAASLPGPVQIISHPEPIAKILSIPYDKRTLDESRELTAHVLTKSLDDQISALPPPQFVYAGTNDFAPDGSHRPATVPRPVHLLRRGDILNPVALAKPGSPSCVGLPSSFQLAVDSSEASRRASLALWLTDRENPLVWRSIVNRVWHYHFGRGIVDTPNDFGRMGSPPSHPELLDWLAADFRDGGGSIKSLHRGIVTSSTYRQSTRHNEAAAKLDADNRLLWRQNRRRLDAESVHDAVLLASGRLDRTMRGPSVQHFALRKGVHVTPVVDYSEYDWNSPESGRRSVYRFLFRTLPDPFLDSLDAADASQLTASRNESLTPLQALALLHNRFMIRQAEFLAKRAEHEAKSDEDRVRLLFGFVLGRPPDLVEIRDWTAYERKHGPANLARLLMNSSEFLFID